MKINNELPYFFQKSIQHPILNILDIDYSYLNHIQFFSKCILQSLFQYRYAQDP